jgi:hypothetical protein
MGVSLWVYRKLPVWGKTDWNSVFPGRDPRIANRLPITVPYFIFYGFWKISHFCSKSMGVSLRFYRKLPVWGKNWSKLRISQAWPPYCESVIYNGPVFQFLRVLKNFTFLLEIQGCQFGAKTDRNSVFLGRDTHIVNQLSITVPYFNFYDFWKFPIFARNPWVLAYGFTENCQFGAKTSRKLRISWSWPPYCESVIYNGPIFHFLWVLKNITFLPEIHGC